MKVSLLDTLTMVSLRIRETEKSFLEKVTGKQLLAAHCCEESIGKTYSFSFQKEKAIFCSPCVSDTPAMPSSPQR